uniref:Uncharacterized protein n=1 Tax=Knipowitschia caucasica TaxID=637954 RepID=A0AAV2MHX8_KNICA
MFWLNLKKRLWVKAGVSQVNSLGTPITALYSGSGPPPLQCPRQAWCGLLQELGERVVSLFSSSRPH